MMLYPSVNGLREKVDSSYTLCMLAAKRARDIIADKPVLTKVEAERPVSLATNEIAEDLITYRRVEEESAAQMTLEDYAEEIGVELTSEAEALEEAVTEEVSASEEVAAEEA